MVSGELRGNRGGSRSIIEIGEIAMLAQHQGTRKGENGE